MSIDSIVNIEKEKLRELQSNMHKLINNLDRFKETINSNNLTDIIILNQNINQLNNLIQKTERNILYNNKSNLSTLNQKRLQEYDEFNGILQKFLPYMLLESMNNSNKQ